MRKILFLLLLLPLLGRGLGGGCVLFAQNGVTVSNLAVSAGTVTFNVSWDKNTMPEALWSDSVWVFVDYNKNGVMERLLLSPGATLTATSAEDVGKVIEEEGNNQGMWVVGNARSAGTFSATVQLLTATAEVAGACAYASNYPPVGKYTSATEISFTGTPQYTIILKNSGGGTEIRKSDSPFTVPADYTVQSFTDKTGAPGTLSCMPSTPYNLTVSATAYCAGSSVTFALSNTTLGQTYRLYKGGDAVDILTGTGNPATFTCTFAGAGVYTAQAIAEKGYCAATMTGTHTVSESPLPTITHSGDNAIQSANQHMAMTAITYTASYAATISMTGSFPTGVSGVADGSSYSISGTPTATGTFDYSLTAAVGGCTSAAVVGTITVNAAPPGLYSASTWSIGGYTWSDRVVAKPSGCSLVSTLSTTIPQTLPKEYKINSDSGVERYYYSWACALAVCPSGWSLPAPAHFTALINATNNTTLINIWGYGGAAKGSTMENVARKGEYWSTEASPSGPDSYCLMYVTGTLRMANNYKYTGIQVRCVK
jgi:hypothetical protein